MTWVEVGEMLTEHQGPFSPDILPNTSDPTVFGRRFTSDDQQVDVYASVVIPDEYLPGYGDNGPDYGTMPADAWDVVMCTEVRDLGDEGGDTSDYAWEHINDRGLTYEAAFNFARRTIAELDAERSFG